MKSKVLDEVLNWFNNEIDIIQKEIDSRNETVNTLQRLVDELTEFDKHSDHKGGFQELSLEYEKEKERLVKLHNHYKMIENECSTLKDEIRGWQEWFSSNKDIFDKLFSKAPQMNFPETIMGEDNISQKKNPEKKSRIIKKKKKDKTK